MTIIFVAGIHAVGKSTVCEAIAAEFSFSHYTASQIIRGKKSSKVPISSKLVDDVAENQRLLIQGVSKILANGDLLLDGHFTLQRKSDGGIEKVDVDVFRELQVGGIVVFTDNPNKIAERMLARDGITPSVEFLEKHQEAEIKQATHVAATLGLPIRILRAFDAEGFANVLCDWEKNKEFR